jgi:hypothetical protein
MSKKTTKKASEINPWGSSLDKLKEWDPQGAELLLRLGTNPWNSGVLPRKQVELISLALHCACTNLDEAGTRRHIRAALDAGATREDEDPAKLAEFYRTLPGVPGRKGARHRLIDPRMHPAGARLVCKTDKRR